MVGLMRSVRLAPWCLMVAAALYMLARAGEFTAGGDPQALSINAFLFLVGLGSAIVLLSPAASRVRARSLGHPLARPRESLGWRRRYRLPRSVVARKRAA